MVVMFSAAAESVRAESLLGGGTGAKFTYATTIVAGVASLAATALSVVSIWLQAKNYRKPLSQRYVVRILLMVPIYSIASFTSMVSLTAAAFIDPVRDIYEAFTIYTFFQLLINYLGGERSLIIMAHGRAPVQHLWPLNYVLRKVDISDPHTFLSIKRGILQYAWLKPILAISAIVMKATGTYQEGYISVTSGYLWSGIVYNISVTLSLYSLGLFWVCMHRDLTPFRPVPKFLCIKLIIFASYWQGFFLSILVWLGAIPDDVQGYTRDNLAAAIQDALICVEMPGFAVAHWYAFSWQDFADNSILSARMQLNHAFKDAFGVKDLIEDSKDTLRGNYGYRAFDSGDKVMAHEDSESRIARLQEGMRYERGGKGKYWLPKPSEINVTSPSEINDGSPLLGGPSSSRQGNTFQDSNNGTFEEPQLDEGDEQLYSSARRMEYGDWNYPVITANEPLAERYRPCMNRQDGRALAWTSGPTRPPTGSRSNSHKQATAAQQEDPPVVIIKKKKKPKKAANHHGSAAQDVGSGKGSSTVPSANAKTSQAVHGSKASQGDTLVDQEAGSITPRYEVDDSEEFRNMWDGDR